MHMRVQRQAEDDASHHQTCLYHRSKQALITKLYYHHPAHQAAHFIPAYTGAPLNAGRQYPSGGRQYQESRLGSRAGHPGERSLERCQEGQAARQHCQRPNADPLHRCETIERRPQSTLAGHPRHQRRLAQGVECFVVIDNLIYILMP